MSISVKPLSNICKSLQQMCIATPVSSCLKNTTSTRYYCFLSALDEFEKEKDLQKLKDCLDGNWPFSTYGPKHDPRNKAFKRVIDEDIAAVFSRLVPRNEVGKKDLLEPESLNVLLLYNLLVRRGVATNVNTLKLHYAMHCFSPIFTNNFNIRWFIAYCDTITDSSLFDEEYRLRTVVASTILNGLKIYISTFKTADFNGLNFLEQLVAMDKERLSIGYGMITYWYKGGDVIANYLERASRLIGQRDFLGLYFHKALHAFIFDNPDNRYLKDLLSTTNNELHKSKIAEIKQRCEYSFIQLNSFNDRIPCIFPN